ncbi:hypothetical protein J6590_009378, partial [Homalodisca vitripennis]
MTLFVMFFYGASSFCPGLELFSDGLGDIRYPSQAKAQAPSPENMSSNHHCIITLRVPGTFYGGLKCCRPTPSA